MRPRGTVEHAEWGSECGQGMKRDLGAGLPASVAGSGWLEAGRAVTALTQA